MSYRDDACTRCKVNPGVWECANCREVPLCEHCVQMYRACNWEGHGCFCAEPKHELSLIMYDGDKPDASCTVGWDAAVKCAVEIVDDD